MKNKLKNIMMIFVLCLIMVNLIPSEIHAARVSYHRGSTLMWTKDHVDFGYKNGAVTYSWGYQQAGWIFPNIARNRGISRYVKRKNTHRYRAINVIGAGVPTPWGDVKIYESTFVHRLVVNGSGSSSAYSD